MAYGPPNREKANTAMKKILRGERLTPDHTGAEPLRDYLTHCIIDLASELGLVICVHAGIWGDFRVIDSKHMLRLAPAHPKARFDLYHLGMPSVRDTIIIAKNMPNVYLNLCWTYIVSPQQTYSGIDEMLDQVPVNKILAFGGDYTTPVEKVAGHLYMAKETLARVFAKRIDRGLINMDDTKEILRKWFWSNPLNLYTKLKI